MIYHLKQDTDMNLIKLFDSFNTENKSKEEADIYLSRKEALRKMGGVAKKMALTALPLTAFTAMPKMAFAQSQDALGVLKFALLLERLEFTYYDMGVNSGIIPANDNDVFTDIRNNEQAHVNLLEETITALGGDPGTAPGFDFTAGGTFPSPFSDYQLFLALSQAFEDTGVKAYKGQAPNIMNNDNLLTTALQIHSVEARHASQVRRMRGEKGWITEANGIDGFGNAFLNATQPIYANENNTTHAGVDATTVTEVEANGVGEAFDEFLTMEQVNNIVSPFLA